MSQIIAIANVKGGVGKTTTTGNLAAALAERGRHVLAVDLDPQASLTLSVGLHTAQMSRTIQAALSSSAAPLSSLLLPTPEHFDLVPADHNLLQVERELLTGGVRIYAVRGALEPLRGRYDYILLDCPANAGILTGNALAAADQVIIPFPADELSLQVLDWFIEIIREMQVKIAPALRVSGLFLALYDPRLLHTREIIATAQKRYGASIPFFSSAVRQSVIVKQAVQQRQSVLRYAPKSQAALAYRTLAEEVEEGIRKQLAEEAGGLLQEGQTALAQHDPARALVRFSTATDVNPSLAEAWIGRGRTSPEWDEAIRCFAQALVVEPSSAGARQELESVLKAHLQTATLRDIPSVMAVGHFLAGAGFQAYSAQAFARVLDLDASHQEAWLSRARQAAQPEEAVRYFERALALNPGNDQIRHELEMAQARVKVEAFELVESGESLLRAGARQEALARFVQATQLYPKIERAWLGCARTTADLGRALEYTERAIEVNPRSPEALELRDWLQQLQAQREALAPARPRRFPIAWAAFLVFLSFLLLALVLLR